MLFTSKVSAAYNTLTHSQKVVANYVDEIMRTSHFQRSRSLPKRSV